MKLLDINKQKDTSYEKVIDVDEDKIYHLDSDLLAILLKDRTTNKNIIWATGSYQRYGEYYQYKLPIKTELITGFNKGVIKPRILKNKNQQQQRSKDKGEVFTPSWVCNKQNNLVDTAWFNRKNVFNVEIKNDWETTLEKIDFPKDKSWKEYVKLNRLEIACGEAPYITSRYDTTSGKYIEVSNRIGLLDRKLRIINENVDEEKEWIKWAIKGVKSIYAYDYQGDNVLLARENALYTVKEFYEYRFNKSLGKDTFKKIARIISWNIWQMDGIKFVIPSSCKIKKKVQYSLYGGKVLEEKCKGCQSRDESQHNGIYSNIKDWKKNKVIKFINLIRGKNERT